MSNIDMTSIVRVKGGKKMTMIEFCDKYGLQLESAVPAADLLFKRGDLTVVDQTTKEEKILNEAMQEEAFNQVLDSLDAEEEAHRQQKRQQILDNTDRLKIALQFVTTLEAQKFAIWLNTQGITEVSEVRKNGALKLLIEDITPAEYTKIANKYKAENAINATVNATSKVVNGTTNAVNYGLSEVVAPVAKLTGEAAMNLGKGIFHTGIKTLAGLVNSGAKAISDTKVAISTDAECLRATRQLSEAKNTIKRGVASKMNSMPYGNGIEIL